MSGEYAPQAILDLGRKITAAIPSAVMSGVVGDTAHVYGYHRCRNVLPAGDYSVQLADDKAGDGWAASALDISLDPSRMRLVTGRLLASAKDRDDPRLDCVREFFGTLDGLTVTGWDTVAGVPASSDDSHLWHVHLSFLRRYATDTHAMAGVLAVIVGEPAMKGAPDVNLTDSIRTYSNGTKTVEDVLKDVYDGVFNKLPDLKSQVATVRTDLAALRAEVHQLAATQSGPTVDMAALTAAVQHAVADSIADVVEAFVAEVMRRTQSG